MGHLFMEVTDMNKYLYNVIIILKKICDLLKMRTFSGMKPKFTQILSISVGALFLTCPFLIKF